MERKIYFDLLNWKNSTDRKPLILQGARQVGCWRNARSGGEIRKKSESRACQHHPRYDFGILS